MMRKMAGLFGMVALALTVVVAVAGSAACRYTPDTPLGQAAMNGDEARIRALIGQGESVLQFDAQGLAPIHLAARVGQTGVLRALIEAGADVNAIDQRGTGWTPLMHAVHKNQAGAVAVLLAAGAHPDDRKSKGVTPLIMAAGYGQIEIVRALLAAGADPRVEDGEGINALWSAAGGAAIADITDGPAFGTCQPEVIALVREHAPDLRIPKDTSTRILMALSRSDECTRLLKELQGN